MLYSIYDNQCNEYLHTGRNSETRERCIEDGLSYLIGHDPSDEKDFDGEEDFPTWKEADRIGHEEYLEGFEFEIHEHEDKMEDE